MSFSSKNSNFQFHGQKQNIDYITETHNQVIHNLNIQDNTNNGTVLVKLPEKVPNHKKNEILKNLKETNENEGLNKKQYLKDFLKIKELNEIQSIVYKKFLLDFQNNYINKKTNNSNKTQKIIKIKKKI